MGGNPNKCKVWKRQHWIQLLGAAWVGAEAWLSSLHAWNASSFHLMPPPHPPRPAAVFVPCCPSTWSDRSAQCVSPPPLFLLLPLRFPGASGWDLLYGVCSKPSHSTSRPHTGQFLTGQTLFVPMLHNVRGVHIPPWGRLSLSAFPGRPTRNTTKGIDSTLL